MKYNTTFLIAHAYATASSIVFFGGYLAGFESKEFNLLSIAPLAICLAAGIGWTFMAQREMDAQVEDEEIEPAQDQGRMVPMGETIHMDESPEVGGPMLLEDCWTLLVSPKGGGSVKLEKIKAVTMAEFVRAGWQVNFRVADLAGKELKDPFRTTPSKAKVTELTDALAKAKLIVKAEGVPTRTLYPLSRMLDHLLPQPLPSGWRGWFR